MRSSTVSAGGLVILVGIGVFTIGGCAAGITADTTLADAAEQLAQLVAADPTLSQLTIGELATAYQSYLTELLSGTAATTDSTGVAGLMTRSGHQGSRPPGLGRDPSSLTSDQLTQLQSLKDQLSAGEITEDEFVTQVQAILGDDASDDTTGRKGAHHGNLDSLLDLTADQQTQAQAIFDTAETDVRALRDDAREQIRALLTEEQLAIFDELCPAPPDPNTLPEPNLPPPSHDGPGMGPGHGHGPHGGPPLGMPAVSIDDPNATTDDDPDAWLDEQLQLTEEQQTQIDVIRTALHDAIEARHEQARADFRAILTADQLAILDQWEADHPRPE